MAAKSVKKNVTEEKAPEVKKETTKTTAKTTSAKPVRKTAETAEIKEKVVETVSKSAPKRTTKKKEITTTVYVEYLGKQVDVKDSIPEIKQLWRKSGHKIRDIKDIKLYAKPEDSKIYFVVNDEFSGSVEL